MFVSIILAAAISAGSAVVPFSDLTSQEVTMFAKDRSVEFSGELVSFEDDLFSINTVFGPVLLSPADYTCYGWACPTIDTASPEVELVSATVETASTNRFVLIGLEAPK